jgi:RNA polymerase primary sigma factor
MVTVRAIFFVEFSPRVPVKTYMFDGETSLDRHEDPATGSNRDAMDDGSAPSVGERSTDRLDPEALFASDLSATTLLTSAEEEALGRRIAHARKRVRAILRKTPQLSRLALAEAGRGVVPPHVDFRERETVAILQYAEGMAMSRERLPQALRMDRRGLRKFVRELSAALANYRTFRDEMVRANVRLVNMLARRYRHPTLTFLDLFQEGAIGLFRAVEKYDPERGIKFSTYATWWIWQQLGRAADTQGALIRTPVHWNQLRRRLGRMAEKDANGHPTQSRASLIDGVTPARLEEMGQTFHFISTDAPLGEDDDRVMESILSGDGVEPEAHAVQESLRHRLLAALENLPHRERDILHQRFGLENQELRTLDEIGTQMGVSRERIRQLESRALKHLKAICDAQGLRDYLN